MLFLLRYIVDEDLISFEIPSGGCLSDLRGQ